MAFERGHDPSLSGTREQTDVIIKSVFHLTNHIDATDWSGRGPPILNSLVSGLVPPLRDQSPPSSSHSYTSTPQGGYHVPFQSNISMILDKLPSLGENGIPVETDLSEEQYQPGKSAVEVFRNFGATFVVHRAELYA